MITLRPYQQKVFDDIYTQWRYVRDVLAVLPTGGGKTIIFSAIVKEFASRNKKVVLQVHRKELVGQISLSLARMGVVHTFIASKETINFCANLHREHLGRSFYSMTANVCVTSVPTLVKRDVSNWASQVDLQICDEAHHCQLSNSWGACWQKFPNALGLGVTATPQRGDGWGLGRHTDGLFDVLVLGPTMREIIDMGSLCDYKVYVPPSDINFEALKVGGSGEYTHNSMDEAMKGSHIVGDAIKHYNRIIPGKRTIAFSTSVDKCVEMAAAFNDSGIPAVALSAKNSNAEREQASRDFVSGKTLVMVNCDLFSEGYDVPACEGVIDCQPTKSLSRFHQKFGRCLRLHEGKTHGVYIDHVRNIQIDGKGNHALPDSPMLWTLDRRKTRSSEEDDNIMKLTVCLECFQPYQANDTVCPHCGAAKPVTAPRASAGPVQIDDELVELTPQRLASLRGEIDDARRDSTEWMRDKFGVSASGIIPMKQRKNHRERKDALISLDDTIATWAGMMREFGMSDDEIHDGFRRQYGMTIYEARVLKRVDAEKLAGQLNKVLQY